MAWSNAAEDLATPVRDRHRPGRPPIEESLGLVTPSQFFEGRALSGEARLMLAVLEDAIQIVTKPGGGRTLRAQRLRAETAEWMLSDDVTSPFSFVSVCDTLRFDALRVRRGLERWLG